MTYIKEQSEELSLKNGHDQVKNSWVRVKNRGNKGNLVLVSTADYLIKWSTLMKPFSSSNRRSNDCRTSSCWGTLQPL